MTSRKKSPLTNPPAISNFEDSAPGGQVSILVTEMGDGTRTFIEIGLRDNFTGKTWPIGRGVAKRRKGEPRNPKLGYTLAIGRAFADAASRYDVEAKGLLGGTKDISSQLFETLDKASARDKKEYAAEQKNKRREAARSRHRKLHGWDHTNRPTA